MRVSQKRTTTFKIFNMKKRKLFKMTNTHKKSLFWGISSLLAGRLRWILRISKVDGLMLNSFTGFMPCSSPENSVFRRLQPRSKSFDFLLKLVFSCSFHTFPRGIKANIWQGVRSKAGRGSSHPFDLNFCDIFSGSTLANHEETLFFCRV